MHAKYPTSSADQGHSNVSTEANLVTVLPLFYISGLMHAGVLKTQKNSVVTSKQALVCLTSKATNTDGGIALDGLKAYKLMKGSPVGWNECRCD